MSGIRTGVQVRIHERQPKALYTHCAGHSLNLAILNSCSVPLIRNFIDNIKSFTLWIKYLAKREELLKTVVAHAQTAHSSGRVPLLKICITRWVENIDGWKHFSQAHPYQDV